MLGGLVRLILLRVLGARVLLGIAALGWLRRMFAGRRDAPPDQTPSREGSAYRAKPPQGR